ncbi:hypothetical protein PPYR_08380 [Photinus pyralis]|uniref:Lipase n=1 Tax=Photinus pyralis TaxID=7054 RepID=A0A5N4AJB8_PHOPY|nr:lipase 1-like [Photinus pyralis]KAB0797386.1 hypothetical protein PPYR_08380 [Photinus pyralis]
MMNTIWFMILCATFLSAQFAVFCHASMNPSETIQNYGYPVEIHKVVTEDGYILNNFRIPYGRKNQTSKPRFPVLLVPGIGNTHSVYLTSGPALSLGYILADEGFDVWLVNNRGTKWSKKHRTLDPIRNKRSFFDYSFEEVGLYDLPAIIDYVLNVTNFKKLFYIGYSQGTTSFFLMASAKPEYNERIMLMTAFAPVTYLFNNQHILLSFFKIHLKELQELTEKNGVYDLFSHPSQITSLINAFCNNNNNGIQFICAVPVYFIGGYSPNLNKRILGEVYKDLPTTISTKTLFHYTQLALAEQFQMYDYGATKNIDKYGQTTPPQLNISKITAPVAFYYGGTDSLATRPDAELLASRLPNIVEKKYFPSYSHSEFLWGDNTVTMLYDDLIRTMKNTLN